MENQDNQTLATEFLPPRHWIGMEELNASYWADQTTQEKRAQEFFDKPIETIAKIDQTDAGGLARRDFLTLMGASMAMASFACARRPVHKIIPYVIKPEEVTPGVANWYASTDAETGVGVLVKTREGRPIKLEGNPDHPMNRGSLRAQGQAAILSLYDPDRLQEPVGRSRSGGSTQANGRRTLPWSEVDTTVQARLKSVAAGSGRVRVLTGEKVGESTRRLIQEFLAGFGSGAHVAYSPVSYEDISEGSAESYGTAVIPHYRIENADVILSLGADFLGTFLSPEEYGKDWISRRKLNAAKAAQATLSKVYCFEPNFTITGANADERYPIRAGDELKIALAVAHELIVVSKHSRYAGDSAVSTALSGYSAEAVARDIGLENGAGKIRAVAKDLWDARGKGLVIAGGIQSKTLDATALQVAVNLLNSALENEGSTVDGTFNPYTQPAAGFGQMAKLISDMKAGLVDILIIYRSNPLYTLPKSAGFEDALKRVQTVIVVGEHEDETALQADLVLPDHHWLENWGDAHPRAQVYSLMQPTIAPMFQTRAFQDSLLTWIRGAELRATGLAPKIASAATENTWHDYLRANWQESLFHKAGTFTSTFDQFWEGVLRDGVLDLVKARGIESSRPSARSFRTSALNKIPHYRASSKDAIVLSLYEKVTMGDGRFANNSWLQELPDPITTVTWDNYLNVGPALAKKLNLQNDDVVEIQSGGATVELPVVVQPGMHPLSVSAAIGYGRRAMGKVAVGVGEDVYPLARVENNQIAYSGQEVKLKKTGKIYRLAATQWHGASENRPIINDITLKEFRKKPAAANETNPELRLETVPSMWPAHEYKGYRWGMAIDLTSCIGCQACVVACQSENNIPVVGRENVRVSRQMHWIRIDRYYSGSPENPHVLFQPMLCQHCENAPCETVCPVLATVHDDEGLNDQVYNRCVGTRYCQNNCPYKVRRFNFFDHWKSYEGTANLAWNPDVTVRSRGIMEKCTFCVQRIRDGKDHAKDVGEKVQDLAIRTACQQTCPTDAIVFGNINDPESRVSKLKEDPRAFRVLETLNTKPSISYLTKVRNTEEGAGHGHH